MAKLWRSEKLGFRPNSCHVQEQSTGHVSIIYYEDGKKRQETLGFGVRDEQGNVLPTLQRKAKEEALALRLRRAKEEEQARTQPQKTTVGVVLDLYRERELPHLSRKRQRGLRRHFEFIENVLGRDFDLQEYNGFLHRRVQRDRERGLLNCHGHRVPEGKRREVKPTTAQGELLTLAQVCHWAARHRTGNDHYLLARDPFHDEAIHWAQAANQKRPVADDLLVERLVEELREGETTYPWQLLPLMLTCWHSGRRVHSVITLRKDDLLLERGPEGSIHWRADTDKMGRDSVVPINAELRAVLDQLLEEHERRRIESPWLFPDRRDKGKPWGENAARRWLVRAEEAVRGYHEPEWGFHALRRGWATKRKHLSRVDVAAAGGWTKDSAVLARLYQAPDPDTLQSVVEGGRRIDFHQLGRDQEVG